VLGLTTAGSRRPPLIRVKGPANRHAYGLTAAIANAGGGVVTSSINVTVTSTVTAMTLTPGVSTLPAGAQQQFAAVATDQFGKPITPQPSLTWTATSGTVSGSGLYDRWAGNGDGSQRHGQRQRDGHARRSVTNESSDDEGSDHSRIR
jgi:hypothetical protein